MKCTKNVISVLLAATVLCCCVFGFSACKQPTQPPVGPGTTDQTDAFDQDNIVLNMAAMSDVHIAHTSTGSGPTCQKLTRGLQYMKKLAGKDLDAVLMAGDITDTTRDYMRESADISAKFNPDFNQDAAILKTVLDEAIDLNKTALFYTLGNHDCDWQHTKSKAGLTDAAAQALVAKIPGSIAKTLGDAYFTYDSDDSDIPGMRRHMELNGYDFFAVQPDKYNNWYGYSQETIDWLDGKLQAVTEKNPDRYVFVLSHPSVYDTAFGSVEDCVHLNGDKSLIPVFDKYPQVVVLTGHMHNDLHNAYNIAQTGKFTAVDCGGNAYINMAALGIDMGYRKQFDNQKDLGYEGRDYANGLLIQIDKDGNVRLTRCAYGNGIEDGGQTIFKPWLLPAPQADNSHLTAYDTDLRKQENAAPVFADDAAIRYQRQGRYLNLSWDCATDAGDDGVVRYYVLKIMEGEETFEYTLSTFIHRYFRVEDIPKTFEYTHNLPSKDFTGEVYVSVTAYDIWGAASETIAQAVAL